MIEIIAIIILLGSVVGMGMIIWRKIPILVELPVTERESEMKSNILNLKEKIKFLNPFRYFSDEIFLQKILSKMRILTLRLESKIANWLQILREKTLKKKIKKNDNYWKELKDSTKKER